MTHEHAEAEYLADRGMVELHRQWAAEYRDTAPIRTPVETPAPGPRIDSPYLTAREAAAYLRVTYGTFRHWAVKITRSKTGRYRREDLDKFAATRRR